MTAITISREIGSNGDWIAEETARRKRVKDDVWKKTGTEEYARSLRLNHDRFGPAATTLTPCAASRCAALMTSVRIAPEPISVTSLREIWP